MKKCNLILLVIICLILAPQVIQARVTEMKITRSISPAFGGASFGKVGKYERIEGVMYCQVDPRATVNAEIVNIDKAPVNEQGLVAYDVDFVIIKPVDMSRGNGRILYDTVNRGGMLTPVFLNDADELAGPRSIKAAGNKFLMEQGYTIVATGWQASYPLRGTLSFNVGMGSRLPPMPGILTARFPVAANADGSSIVDMSREEYFDPPFNTPKRNGTYLKYLTYPAADTSANGKSRARLTVRRHEKDKDRMEIKGWEYVDEYRITFKQPAGYDSGALYEFIFPAKDPVVYGLALASIRDVVSFLRYETEDEKGNANPLATKAQGDIKGALAFGASQSGRLIKTFVYEGFNESEDGPKVFDGINSHIGASRKLWINGQFCHPGDIFGNDQFPFTYAEETDQFTSLTGSVLSKCKTSDTCPKIIHTDTESEIWSSAASLVITDTSGTRDTKLPENVRAYMFTGAKHMSGGNMTPTQTCQQIANPLDYRPLLRALLIALDRWATQEIEPPESRYPNMADGSFVLPEELDFPEIPAFSYLSYDLPAVNYNGLYLGAYYLDYNIQPPEVLGEYPIYVIKVDQDGNGLAGVSLPDIQVPIATYTGWNRNAPGFGGDDRLCTASGSFLPFAATKQERLANGDPRLSIEERYPTHRSYTQQVSLAARQLVAKGLLLKQDADAIIKAANRSDIAK